MKGALEAAFCCSYIFFSPWRLLNVVGVRVCGGGGAVRVRGRCGGATSATSHRRMTSDEQFYL